MRPGSERCNRTLVLKGDGTSVLGTTTRACKWGFCVPSFHATVSTAATVCATRSRNGVRCGRHLEVREAMGDVRRRGARRRRSALGTGRPRAVRARHPSDAHPGAAHHLASTVGRSGPCGVVGGLAGVRGSRSRRLGSDSPGGPRRPRPARLSSQHPREDCRRARCLQGGVSALVSAVLAVATLMRSVWNGARDRLRRIPGLTTIERWRPSVPWRLAAERTLATDC